MSLEETRFVTLRCDHSADCQNAIYGDDGPDAHEGAREAGWIRKHHPDGRDHGFVDYCAEHARQYLRECIRCERPIRPEGRKATDFEYVTMAQGARGMCTSCSVIVSRGSTLERDMERAVEAHFKFRGLSTEQLEILADADERTELARAFLRRKGAADLEEILL